MRKKKNTKLYLHACYFNCKIKHNYYEWSYYMPLTLIMKVHSFEVLVIQQMMNNITPKGLILAITLTLLHKRYDYNISDFINAFWPRFPFGSWRKQQQLESQAHFLLRISAYWIGPWIMVRSLFASSSAWRAETQTYGFQC